MKYVWAYILHRYVIRLTLKFNLDTYLYADWNGTFPLPPPPTDDGTIVSMSDYTVYDTDGDFDDIMIFRQSRQTNDSREGVNPQGK